MNMYEYYLIQNDELSIAHDTIRVSEQNTILRLQMRLNYLELAETFKVVVQPVPYLMGDNEYMILHHFLNFIAFQNDTTVPLLLRALGDWFNNTNHKRKGLILYGLSNTGKSMFLNMLLSIVPSFLIGVFNCPPSNAVNTFWLMECTDTFFYRCDEFLFESPLVLQTMKKLFEGSYLTSDVKYKNAAEVKGRPVCLSCNATSTADMLKWFPKIEQDAIANRVTYIRMCQNISDFYTHAEIGYLSTLGPLLHTFIAEQVRDVVNTQVIDFREFAL